MSGLRAQTTYEQRLKSKFLTIKVVRWLLAIISFSFSLAFITIVVPILSISYYHDVNAREARYTQSWSKELKGEANWPHSLSISEDGSHVALGSANAFREGAIHYFDSDGNLLWTFNTDRRIFGTAVSGNGSQILAAGFQLSGRKEGCTYGCGVFYANGALYSLDKEGRLLWNYTTEGGKPIMSFASSSDDRYLFATTDEDLLFFDAWQGRLLWNFTATGDDEGASFNRISMSSDGQYAFASASITSPRYPQGEWKGYFFSVNNGTIIWDYTSTDASTSDLSVMSADGKYVAVGAARSGYDGYVYFFDSKGNLLWNKQINSPMDDAAISSDGSFLAASTNWGWLFFDRQGNTLWNETRYNGEDFYLTHTLVATSANGSSTLTGVLVESGNNAAGVRNVQLRNKSGMPFDGTEVDGAVSSIAMTHDASHIVIVSHVTMGQGASLQESNKIYVYKATKFAGHVADNSDGDNNNIQASQTGATESGTTGTSYFTSSFSAIIGIGAAIAGVIAFLTLRKRKK